METKKYTDPDIMAFLWRTPIIMLMLFELAYLKNHTGEQEGFTALGLLVQSFVFYCFFEITHFVIKKNGKTPPWWVASMMTVLLAVDAAGDYMHWYQSIPYYDSILHFFVPMTALFAIWTIRRVYGLSTTYSTLLFTVLPCVVTLSALYEMEEYLEDIITGSHRLGDGFDTANDLLMGFLGAVIPIATHYTYMWSKKRKRITELVKPHFKFPQTPRQSPS